MKHKKLKIGRLIKVRWLDHKSSAIWHDIEDVCKNFKPAICVSVGHVIENNNNYIIVAGDIGVGDNTCSNITLIIWTCIDKIEYLD